MTMLWVFRSGEIVKGERDIGESDTPLRSHWTPSKQPNTGFCGSMSKDLGDLGEPDEVFENRTRVKFELKRMSRSPMVSTRLLRLPQIFGTNHCRGGLGSHSMNWCDESACGIL